MSSIVIIRPFAAALLGLLAVPSLGSAQAPRADAYEAIVLQSHEFLTYHPDLRFRGLGMDARERGRDEEARTQFRNAARYGDKLSQAALADMLWNGQGVPPTARWAMPGWTWPPSAAPNGWWCSASATGRR